MKKTRSVPDLNLIQKGDRPRFKPNFLSELFSEALKNSRLELTLFSLVFYLEARTTQAGTDL